jgi:hypothetical protein
VSDWGNGLGAHASGGGLGKLVPNPYLSFKSRLRGAAKVEEHISGNSTQIRTVAQPSDNNGLRRQKVTYLGDNYQPQVVVWKTLGY